MTPHHDPAADPRAWLSSLTAELLGLPEGIPADRPLGEIGIDSLTAAQLSVEVEERTGATIPLERFLGDETIADLARELAASQEVARA
ncbi:acyl carrier protein [Streptomyces sp. NPDC049577]|uniref:acyl carrier protein n=1 Tax=Streptomyces sp. NPDC049577 TaxID=3155153 RepID=UPI00341B98E2